MARSGETWTVIVGSPSTWPLFMLLTCLLASYPETGHPLLVSTHVAGWRPCRPGRALARAACYAALAVASALVPGSAAASQAAEGEPVAAGLVGGSSAVPRLTSLSRALATAPEERVSTLPIWCG
jgi:hypothetical protein